MELMKVYPFTKFEVFIFTRFKDTAQGRQVPSFAMQWLDA